MHFPAVRFSMAGFNTDDLAFIGRDNKPVVERGQFKVSVADLSKTFEIR